MIDLSSWPEGRGSSCARNARTRALSSPSPTSTGTASPRSSPTHPAGSSATRSPGWSCGTASTPGSKTASARASKPGCATCPAGRGGKQRLAGGRARRRRPGLLGQADLPHRRAVAGPLRDRHLPLPDKRRVGARNLLGRREGVTQRYLPRASRPREYPPLCVATRSPALSLQAARE